MSLTFWKLANYPDLPYTGVVRFCPCPGADSVSLLLGKYIQYKSVGFPFPVSVYFPFALHVKFCAFFETMQQCILFYSLDLRFISVILLFFTLHLLNALYIYYITWTMFQGSQISQKLPSYRKLIHRSKCEFLTEITILLLLIDINYLK